SVLPHIFLVGKSGLSLFFVISGFVITTSLTKHLASAQELPSFLERLGAAFETLKSFFVRRLCRLLPLVFFNFLIALGIFFWAFEEDLLPYCVNWDLSLLRIGIEHLFCVYNLAIPPYLETEPMHYNGLGPYWSLSVEGQFYFLWPLLLLLFKTASRQALCALTLCALGLFVARPAAAAWMDGTSYYHTCSNIDGLFLGAFLAFLKTVAPPSSQGKASWGTRGCAGLLIGILWIYPGLTNHEGSYGSVPALGCSGALVWLAAQDRNGVLGGRLMAPFFAFVGKRSYAFYIFHTLIASFTRWFVEKMGFFQTESGARTDFYATGQFFIFLGLLFVLVEISHRCIEEPVRRWGRKITTAPH
ncbi:MAG: acyltransferase, partial [Holosporales bacterium]|nr:acyltransferase [Holosporales bacterium]